MERFRATKLAIDLARHYLESCDLKQRPNKDSAESLAEFIEALTDRLEKMDDGDQ